MIRIRDEKLLKSRYQSLLQGDDRSLIHFSKRLEGHLLFNPSSQMRGTNVLSSSDSLALAATQGKKGQREGEHGKCWCVTWQDQDSAATDIPRKVTKGPAKDQHGNLAAV